MLIKNSNFYHILYTYFSARIILKTRIHFSDVKKIKHLFDPTEPNKYYGIKQEIISYPQKGRRKLLLAYARFLGSIPG